MQNITSKDIILMNISRQKAYLTGSNGSYSTDNIKGTSELMDTNGFNGSLDTSYVGNYNNSYKGGMNGSVLLGQPDYTNPGNILHNNVGDRVMGEQIFDHKLFIDSSIRDYSRSPDPFKFMIKFNGIEAKTENVYVIIDGETYSYPRYLEGDTDVVMDRIFKNIKSVVINTLLLPIFIDYKTNEDGSYSPTGLKLSKSAFKYLILKIDELTNNRCYSNNKVFGKESFIMKMDDEICIFNHRWIPISNNVCYPDSRLKFIDRLTVEICNDKGVRLCPTLDGKNHDFYAEYRKLINKIILLKKSNNSESILTAERLVPKLNSLKEITQYLSPELHLTFCILEPQVATFPQYRH
jgi:hypothetical protein